MTFVITKPFYITTYYTLNQRCHFRNKKSRIWVEPALLSLLLSYRESGGKKIAQTIFKQSDSVLFALIAKVAQYSRIPQ